MYVVLVQKWYRISKTLAEEAAWKFVKEHGIDMVSINPSAVIGPMLQPRLASSVALILNLINGNISSFFCSKSILNLTVCLIIDFLVDF